MALENRLLDVLQNIEFGIVDVHRQKPDLVDYDVMESLDALIACYRAESLGHTQKNGSSERASTFGV